MTIDKYDLINEEKVRRAIYGTIGQQGRPVGGVGEDASDVDKITEYDRLGGLIKLGGDKVKQGSFYDFESRRPRTTPEVMLQFSINGQTVNVAADQELPPLVRAAKEAEKGLVGAVAEGEEKENKPTGSLIGSHKRSSKKHDETES